MAWVTGFHADAPPGVLCYGGGDAHGPGEVTWDDEGAGKNELPPPPPDVVAEEAHKRKPPASAKAPPPPAHAPEHPSAEHSPRHK